MTDVAETAEVSRGTLYRHFENKDAVLHGVAGHVRSRVAAVVADEVSADLAGPEKVRVVIRSLSDLMGSREFVDIIRVDPGFALEFLEQQLGSFASVVEQALQDTVGEVAAVQSGDLTALQVADLLVRLTITMHLLPTPRGETAPTRVAALWAAVTDPGDAAPVVEDDAGHDEWSVGSAASHAGEAPGDDDGAEDGPAETRHRILDGAMRALERRGLRKLSMSDIAEEAGVSRGTLYRYFSDKDAVLTGVAGRVRAGIRDAMLEAVTKDPRPEVRVRVVLDALGRANERYPQTGRIIEIDPGFALESLTASLPERVANTHKALGGVLDGSAPVRRGVLTSEELVGLLVRLGTSRALMPPAADRDLPMEVQLLWDSMHHGSTVVRREHVGTSA